MLDPTLRPQRSALMREVGISLYGVWIVSDACHVYPPSSEPRSFIESAHIMSSCTRPLPLPRCETWCVEYNVLL